MTREQYSPCHGTATVGGQARVWCPTCGRVYQADDPRLVSAPPVAPTFSDACADDYAHPATAPSSRP